MTSWPPVDPPAARPGPPATPSASFVQRPRIARPPAPGAVSAPDAAGAWPRLDRRLARRTPLVLAYAPGALRSPAPLVAAQLRVIARAGLRAVPVGELLAAYARGEAAGLVGLTFDDARADFAHVGVPLLCEAGFGATAYVAAGRLERGAETYGAQPMTERQLRMVAFAGMEVGTHGLSHLPLTRLGPIEMVRETLRAREVLRDVLGTDVTGFCYPYDELDARVVEAVRQSGYHHGCAVARSPLTGRLALPRTYLRPGDGRTHLVLKRLRHRLVKGRGPSRGLPRTPDD